MFSLCSDSQTGVVDMRVELRHMKYLQLVTWGVYEDCYSEKASGKENTLKQCIIVFTLSCRCLLRSYRGCPQV